MFGGSINPLLDEQTLIFAWYVSIWISFRMKSKDTTCWWEGSPHHFSLTGWVSYRGLLASYFVTCNSQVIRHFFAQWIKFSICHSHWVGPLCDLHVWPNVDALYPKKRLIEMIVELKEIWQMFIVKSKVVKLIFYVIIFDHFGYEHNLSQNGRWI